MKDVISPIITRLSDDISPNLSTFTIDNHIKPELERFITSLPERFRVKQHAPGSRQLSADEAAVLLQLRLCTLVSIDLEEWERDQHKLTEIGICMYNPSHQHSALFPHIVCKHFIIKEFESKLNGRFVPDAKFKNLTGVSDVISIDNAKRALLELFTKLGPYAVMVGHGFKGDLQTLRACNIDIPESVKYIDTLTLWQAIADGNYEKSSLGYIIDKLGIPNSFLHNGANDAYFTLIACLKMCSPEFVNHLTMLCKSSKKQNRRKQSMEVDGDSTPLPKPMEFRVVGGVSDKDIELKMSGGQKSAGSKRRRKPSKPNYFFSHKPFQNNQYQPWLEKFIK